uniref:Peroxisomal membrane protein 2 n=1 Tax=Takifugu rubripes TaxID=31033 RepID=A0A674MSS0_TAKRU
MPVKSVPIQHTSVHFRLLQQYLFLLKRYPIITKSVTRSDVLHVATGGFLRCSQLSLLFHCFVCYRLFITGPVSHCFYQLMEALIPTTDPHCIIKRLLLDRLIFAPGFLLIFYFVMNILEVRTSQNGKLKGSFWTALKMNWKVWTPFQFVNINFVPVQFRVLFANMVALFWYAYLASVRK